MDRQCQAFETTPAIADSEQFERIDERSGFRLAAFEDEREQSGRTGEITLPDFVSGAIGQGGVQNGLDFGTFSQPMGDFQC